MARGNGKRDRAKGRGRKPAAQGTSAPPSTPKPVGRPSKYTQGLAEQFCELIADCKTVKEALAELGSPVDPGTIRRWELENEDFRKLYARAREAQADVDADEIRNLARRQVGDLREGETALTCDQARIAIDARKWLAGKRNRKRYGLDADLDDEDGGTMTVVIVRHGKGKPNG
jgi:hypothetical protein